MADSAASLPKGSKLWLLDLGHLDMDAAVVFSGANIFPAHLPPQQHERRDLVMIAALLHHPNESLVCTPRIWDKNVHGLPEAMKATGAGDISDVKAVVISHLHCDHAGGLEHFMDSDVEIWCHEEELKNAFWTTATGIEQGTYRPDYLIVDRLKWRTFSGTTFELFPGVNLHLCPGHTPGGIVVDLDLEETGCVVLTGDAFHIAENYELGIPPGALTRDFNAWHRSRQYIRNLAQKKKAKVVLGHDVAYFRALQANPGFIQ
ncbi:N-acyl homoserine lactonase AiiB [Paramyrothecium foliicola]|nr:N-acyl homoserine lactonase AiiB [Paramyrothecium foliicola]